MARVMVSSVSGFLRFAKTVHPGGGVLVCRLGGRLRRGFCTLFCSSQASNSAEVTCRGGFPRAPSVAPAAVRGMLAGEPAQEVGGRLSGFHLKVLMMSPLLAILGLGAGHSVAEVEPSTHPAPAATKYGPGLSKFRQLPQQIG
jgi:hypothetical protein